MRSVVVGGQWQAYQRSIWNDHTADLAIDNSSSTCYVSGYDIGAWWFVDLGEQRVVDSVIISGRLSNCYKSVSVTQFVLDHRMGTE